MLKFWHTKNLVICCKMRTWNHCLFCLLSFRLFTYADLLKSQGMSRVGDGWWVAWNFSKSTSYAATRRHDQSGLATALPCRSSNVWTYGRTHWQKKTENNMPNMPNVDPKVESWSMTHMTLHPIKMKRNKCEVMQFQCVRIEVVVFLVCDLVWSYYFCYYMLFNHLSVNLG